MKKQILLTLCATMLLFSACKDNKKAVNDMSQEDIIEVLTIRINKDPKNADLYHDRGKVLLDLNRTNEAIADLTIANNLEPKEISHLMLLGDAYFATGNVEQSYQKFQEAINLEPENTEAHLKLGEIAFYSKDYDRSLTCLSKVTETDKNNLTALFMKGFIYKEKGDTANAVTLFRRVCDAHPDYSPAFEELGMLYATRNNPLAIEYLNTAIRINPANNSAKYALAMFYQDAGDVANAEELYKSILDNNAGHAPAWHNRGFIQLYYLDEPNTAIEYFTRAIQIDPQFIEALTNRGIAYITIGERDKAKDDFNAALAIDPQFKPAVDAIKQFK